MRIHVLAGLMALTICTRCLHANEAPRLDPDGSPKLNTVFVGDASSQITSIVELLNSDAFGFRPPAVTGSSIRVVRRQPDGKLVVGRTTLLHRLNSNGSADSGFSVSSGDTLDLEVLASGKIIAVGPGKCALLNSTGTASSGFNIGTGPDNTIRTVAVQSNGKFLIGGDFLSFNGFGMIRLARLNTNGSVDTTFDAGLSANGAVNCIEVQSDGKILVGGSFTEFNGAPAGRIVRLNADGSLDASFDPGTGADLDVTCITIQSDGMVLVGGLFRNFDGDPFNRIVRLQSDGSTDFGFDPGTGASNVVRDIKQVSTGEIYVCGGFSQFDGLPSRGLALLDSDGTFNFALDVGAGIIGEGRSVLVDPQDRIVLAGSFTSYDGETADINNIVRLFPEGARAYQRITDPDGPDSGIAITSVDESEGLWDYSLDGGNTWDPLSGVSSTSALLLDRSHDTLIRFNPDFGLGATLPFAITYLAWDQSFGFPGDFEDPTGVDAFSDDEEAASITIIPNSAPTLDDRGEFSIAAVAEDDVNNMGTLISDLLESGAGKFDIGDGFDSPVNALAIQSTGNILVGGEFTEVNGRSSFGIERLTPEGKVDSSFQGFVNGAAYKILVLPDDKILVGGDFLSSNGSPPYFQRLNANGTVDGSFNANQGVDGAVYAIAVQSDGKILIGGEFFGVGLVESFGIARLNTNGSRDATFDTGVNEGFNDTVYSILVQPDGKILIGGAFDDYRGNLARGIIRLNPNGSVDSTFQTGFGFDDDVYSMALQADGRIVVGGAFSDYDGNFAPRIIRLESDGSIDYSFDPGAGADGDINTVVIDADGTILIGGSFLSYDFQDSRGLARLLDDGSFDPDFFIGDGADVDVLAIAISPNGRINAGGGFESFDTLSRKGLTQLFADGYQVGQPRFDDDDISPEFGDVIGIAVVDSDTANGTWEFSLDDGASWQPLGAVAEDDATLLAADGVTRIRFVPATDYFGTIDEGLAFRMWDLSQFSNGMQHVDATFTGGEEPFSDESDTVSVTVLPVNDRPLFTKGPNITVAESKLAQSFPGWATGISVGPLNEVQTITGSVISFTGPQDVFSVAPAVAGNGTLTFTPAANINAVTTLTVTVQLQDSGGTPNGGTDLSAPQVFTITLTPVADSLIVTTVDDTGPGSLRDCLQRARNGDLIAFDQTLFSLLNSTAATLINVRSPLPELDDGNVVVDASDRRVTLNGSAAGDACGLLLTSSNNRISGLSIIGFTSSGVCLRGGASSNTIGGDRSAGTGPNGQGLRISQCGAFGVEISGAGTNLNMVKGCWIGLSSSGQNAENNLAGVLIKAGARSNIIGSTVAGEANAISGNAFEGVTVSDAGTDDNVIIGNSVGTVGTLFGSRSVDSRAADEAFIPSRSLGNGSAGLFLSQGTKRTKMGGTASGQGNIVGFNGASGVEVRAIESKNNTASNNRISQNKRGGIQLFNDSNGGIRPPTFQVEGIPGRTSRGIAGRAVKTVRINGAADRDGIVEIFSDTGEQGGTILGRSTVTLGRWTAQVDFDELQNLTATLTDNDGNTSPFAFFASPAVPADPSGGLSPKPGDSDGDGVSDALEKLAGTNPNDKADFPSVGGGVAVAKLSIALNFAKPGNDTLTATLGIIPPAGFETDGSTISILIGGMNRSFTLDEKGASPKGSETLKARESAAGITLTLALKKTDLQAQLATTGLTNRTAANEAVALPVGAAIVTPTGKSVYINDKVSVTYKATQGKSGKASKAK